MRDSDVINEIERMSDNREFRKDISEKKFASYFRFAKAAAIAETLIDDPEAREAKTVNIYRAVRCYTEEIVSKFMEEACEVLELDYEKADLLDRVIRYKLELRPREEYEDDFFRMNRK